jgi:hypothetical protein
MFSPLHAIQGCTTNTVQGRGSLAWQARRAGVFFFDALSLHGSQFCPRKPRNATQLF